MLTENDFTSAKNSYSILSIPIAVLALHARNYLLKFLPNTISSRNHQSIKNHEEVLGNEDVEITTAKACWISSNENNPPTKHPEKVPNIQMGSNSISPDAPGLVEATMIVPKVQLPKPPSCLISGNENILPNTISSRNQRSIKNPEEVLGNEDVEITSAKACLISSNENILPTKHPEKVPNIQMGSNSISPNAPGLVEATMIVPKVQLPKPPSCLISGNKNILPTKHPEKVPNIQMESDSISLGAPGLVEATVIVPNVQLLEPPSCLISSLPGLIEATMIDSQAVSRTTIVENILSTTNKMNLLIDLLENMVHINNEFFQIFVHPNDQHSYIPTAYDEDWPRNLSFSQIISAYKRGYNLAKENYTRAITKAEGHSKDYGFPFRYLENYGFPHPFIFNINNFPASHFFPSSSDQASIKVYSTKSCYSNDSAKI